MPTITASAGLNTRQLVLLHAAEKARKGHALRQSLRDKPSPLCRFDPGAERKAFGNDMGAAREDRVPPPSGPHDVQRVGIGTPLGGFAHPLPKRRHETHRFSLHCGGVLSRSLSLVLRFAHQPASSAWLGCGFVTSNFIATFTGSEAETLHRPSVRLDRPKAGRRNRTRTRHRVPEERAIQRE